MSERSFHIANVKPSTRDLARFVSPNAKKTERMVLLQETDGTQLYRARERFSAWEDEEIAALIIDTSEMTVPISKGYLTEVEQALSCPLVRKHDARHTDNLIESRFHGFDAQISSIAFLDDVQIGRMIMAGDAMHFRFVASVGSVAELRKMLGFKPHFLYIEKPFPEAAALVSPQTWLIGAKSLSEQIALKAIVESI